MKTILVSLFLFGSSGLFAQVSSASAYAKIKTNEYNIGITIGKPFVLIATPNSVMSISDVNYTTNQLVTGVSNMMEENYLTIAPNPFSHNVQVLSNIDIRSIVVYSITGDKIYESSENIITVDLYNIPPGIYFMECVTANGKTINNRIIKQ